MCGAELRPHGVDDLHRHCIISAETGAGGHYVCGCQGWLRGQGTHSTTNSKKEQGALSVQRHALLCLLMQQSAVQDLRNLRAEGW